MTEAKKLYLECFDSSTAEADIIIGYAEKYGSVHLLKQGDIAVNMVCTARIADVGFEADYIFAVCTKPEYRGRGIFRAQLESIAGGRPALLIPENESLVPMYEKLGFSPIYYLEAEINGGGGAEDFTGGIGSLYEIYKNSNQFPKKDFRLFEATISAHLCYGGRILTKNGFAMLVYENTVTDIFTPTVYDALNLAKSGQCGQYNAIFPLEAEEMLRRKNIKYRKNSVVMGKNLPNTQIYINTLFN